jgi:hypothetical protein
MRQQVAIANARDVVPAQRIFSAIAVAVFALTLPHLAHAQPLKKTSGISRATVQAPASRAVKTPPVTTAVSLRAANDTIPATAKVDPPTGSIRGVAMSPTVGLSANAAMPPPRTPLAVPPRPSSREWYPESHSYLRPYHYKWRYWTPG